MVNTKAQFVAFVGPAKRFEAYKSQFVVVVVVVF